MRIRSFLSWYSVRRHRTLFYLLLALVSGCGTVKPEPFQAFSQSVQQLKIGTDKALETNESMSSDRFLREALQTTAKLDDRRVEQLRLAVDSKNPFALGKSTIPLFMSAEKFRQSAAQALGVFASYSDLLVRLSSPELLPRATFDKMTENLNANAYDAALAVNDKIPDPKEVALLSTVTVALTREYLESKRRSKLVEALTASQPTVDAFADRMRMAVSIAARNAAQEYTEEFQELYRKLISGAVAAPEAVRREVIHDLIELDRKYIQQLAILQSLYNAFGQLPTAHSELIKAAENNDFTMTTVVAVLEEGKRLEGLYDKSVAVNKVKAAQALADRSTALADKLDAEAESAQLRADRAATEAEKAKGLADANPSDIEKKTRATELQELAKKLKDEADAAKKKAADARVSAREAQKQADEVKKKLAA